MDYTFILSNDQSLRSFTEGDGGRHRDTIKRGLATEHVRLGTYRGFGTERARQDIFGGFGTECVRLGTFRGFNTECAILDT